MGILDWVKDLPISEIQKARIELVEEEKRSLKEENDRLREQIGVLKSRIAKLKQKVHAQIEAERYVEHLGVLWKKGLIGKIEHQPYCPKCKFIMVGYFDRYECHSCNIRSNFNPQQVAKAVQFIENYLISINKNPDSGSPH